MVCRTLIGVRFVCSYTEQERNPEMRTLRTFLYAFVAVLVATLILHAGNATAGRATLRYREVGADGPVLIVRGAGCLQAEDSTTLRLVEWEGTDSPVVYRCVAP